MRLGLCGFVALGLVACSSGGRDEPADSKGPAGVVVALSGTVTATRDGADARPLAVDAIVFGDDTITTADDGSVKIKLDHNNAVLELAGGKTRKLRESAAWKAAKQSGEALAKEGTDKTTSAGRHAEPSAADTRNTARRPTSGILGGKGSMPEPTGGSAPTPEGTNASARDKLIDEGGAAPSDQSAERRMMEVVRTRYLEGLATCQDTAKLSPGNRVVADVELTIGETGEVTKVSSRSTIASLDGCIEKLVKTWRFPPPEDKDGNPTSLTLKTKFPFTGN